MQWGELELAFLALKIFGDHQAVPVAWAFHVQDRKFSKTVCFTWMGIRIA
jgi:hypothetical protein